MTVEGTPFPGARLMLVPVGGDKAFQRERPVGVTDEQGKFELTTFYRGDGAPRGDFKVMIRPLKPQDAEQAALWKSRKMFHPKYSTPKTSGLTVSIGADDTTLPPFDLEAGPSRGRR